MGLLIHLLTHDVGSIAPQSRFISCGLCSCTYRRRADYIRETTSWWDRFMTGSTPTPTNASPRTAQWAPALLARNGKVLEEDQIQPWPDWRNRLWGGTQTHDVGSIAPQSRFFSCGLCSLISKDRKRKGPALSQWSLPAMVTIVLSLSLPWDS